MTCLKCGRAADDLIHDHPNDHGWTGTDGMHPFVGEAEKQLLQRVSGELGWHRKTGRGKSSRPLAADQKRWNAAIDKAQAVIESMFTPIDPAVLAANDKYFADKRQARAVSEAAPAAQPDFSLTMETRGIVIHGDAFVQESALNIAAAWADLSERLEALGIRVTKLSEQP